LPTKPEIQANVRVASHQADALLHLPDGVVIVEIKRAAPDANVADQLSSFIDDAQRSNPEAPVAGLIVLQNRPSDFVARELRHRGFAPVRWATKRDDHKLAAALANAFEAA
jgi:RecB family endonuclease NucS